MSKLTLDRDRIEQAKRLAEQIVSPVQHLIDRHTTVSIERCVLRLMGVEGTYEEHPKKEAPQGHLPLVNKVTERLGPDRLALGAGYWMGRAALKHPELDAVQLARRIAEGKIDLEKLPQVPVSELNRVCQKFLRPALDVLRQNREKKSKRPSWSRPHQPLRYVIVATGNIYEDIPQAQAAAEMGADIVAVIRSTAQSLLDYVPEGATTEGYGGTFATQENFRLMREALDATERHLKRRVALCNYSSGLCMPEIAVLGALEGVDYLLNDAMYGILFRDINMKRNFVDQFFSRRICALSGITIQTGEDNYLTTADSYKYWYQVLASHFINYSFAKRAGIAESCLALGHAFEMDPNLEDSILYEWAQAQLVRELFPRAPLKFMPPTKHKGGDIFFSYLYDGMFNLAGILTGQTIQLLGMHTEAIHNPYIQDRYLSLKNANYVFNAAKGARDEITFQPHGKIARRARQVFDDALHHLKKVRMRGLFKAIEEGAFANVRRRQEDGKGLDGVFHKARDYYTPLQQYLTPRALREAAEGGARGRPAPQRRSGSYAKRPQRSRGRGDRNRLERKRPPKKQKESPRRRESAPKGSRPERRSPPPPPKPLREKPVTGKTEAEIQAEMQKEFHRQMVAKENTTAPHPPEPEKKKTPPPPPDYQPLPRRTLTPEPEGSNPPPSSPPHEKPGSSEEDQAGYQPLPRRPLKEE